MAPFNVAVACALAGWQRHWWVAPKCRDASWIACEECGTPISVLGSPLFLSGELWSKQLPLAWQINMDTMLLMEEEGWEYTPRVQQQIARMFKHQLTTLTTERAFQHLRDHERDNSSQEQSVCSLWRKPTTDAVLSQHHAYPEVQASTIVHAEVPSGGLPSSFFKPVFKCSSDSFKDLPGVGSGVDWSHPTASNLPQLGASQGLSVVQLRQRHVCKGPKFLGLLA